MDYLKQACWLHLNFAVHRYLMSNADGRASGAEKAQRHEEMSAFYVAVFKGVEVEQVRRHYAREYKDVHDKTQELTDNLDIEIGFPLRGTPDYDDLAPKFFERFHALALQAMSVKAET